MRLIFLNLNIIKTKLSKKSLNNGNPLHGQFKILLMIVSNDKLDLFIYLMMDKNIKVNGLKTKEMAKESIFGLMVKDMMDFGKMENLMDLEDKFMLTAIFMKEIFLKIKKMALVRNYVLMVKFIKVSGLMINEKDKEIKHL